MSKIIVTDLIRNEIKNGRKKIGKNSVELSQEVKGSNTYISLIENERIAKINIEDLKKIFNIILKIEGTALDEYIDNLIKNNKEDDDDTESFDEDVLNNNNENFKVNEYKVDITKNDYQKLLKDIQKGFTFIFNKASNKDYVFSNILRFNQNMHFDLGFITALVGIPFYAIQNASIEDKQAILNEIVEVVQKYIEKYKSSTENDSSKENV